MLAGAGYPAHLPGVRHDVLDVDTDRQHRSGRLGGRQVRGAADQLGGPG
jgi:hypothetical protein